VLAFALGNKARARIARLRSSHPLAASEVVECHSIEQVRARLAGSRPFTALVVEAGCLALDRDLIDTARQAGCAVIVVENASAECRIEWERLGATAVVPRALIEGALGDVLDAPPPPHPRSTGLLAAVCGARGAGTSTIAIALAQGLAAEWSCSPKQEPTESAVLLADFAINGEAELYHHLDAAAPRVTDLVASCRRGEPEAAAVRGFALPVPTRGYDLLAGLRSPRSWTVLAPRAFVAALDSLRRAYAAVVADVTADLEGEDDSGSTDIEERNLMARTAVSLADVVFVVSVPGRKGAVALWRVLDDVARLRADTPGGVVPVLNRVACGACDEAATCEPPAREHPVLVTEAPIEAVLVAGRRLPCSMTTALTRAWHTALDGSSSPPPTMPALRPVAPGSLGSWPREGEL